MSVSLMTFDRVLDDIILREYQGIIKGVQRVVVEVDGRKAYLFNDLNEEELSKFIAGYRNKHYYVIFDGNGRIEVSDKEGLGFSV